MLQYNFVKSEYREGQYIVSFKIDGLTKSEQTNRICDELKKLEVFNDILIDINSNCTLKSYQEIDYSTVNRAVRSNGAEIDSEYIVKSSN